MLLSFPCKKVASKPNGTPNNHSMALHSSQLLYHSKVNLGLFAHYASTRTWHSKAAKVVLPHYSCTAAKELCDNCHCDVAQFCNYFIHIQIILKSVSNGSWNLNILSMKLESYPKSRTFNVFEQINVQCHSQSFSSTAVIETDVQTHSQITVKYTVHEITMIFSKIFYRFSILRVFISNSSRIIFLMISSFQIV